MTSLWVGTSGYSYPEWKGSFYPEKIPQKQMFAYYAERFSTVEINNTFYKMPNEELLSGWSSAANDGFRFALKAPQRITHIQRLKAVDDTLSVFLERAKTLGPKLGVILFQLPPNMKKNAELLRDFVARLPEGTRAAFEFRNTTWHDDEVFSILRERNVALCIADSEKIATPFVATATYGYLRLRDEGYDESHLRRYRDFIADVGRDWTEAFVYFKHEDEGKGPEYAARFLALDA